MKITKTIIYKPVICPECGSDKTFIRTKQVYNGEVIRFHKCKRCFASFRSIEE